MEIIGKRRQLNQGFYFAKEPKPGNQPQGVFYNNDGDNI